MYPKYNNKYYSQNDDRFFFAAPFLFGALAGGAVASTTRPRPVFVSSPPNYYQSGGYNQMPQQNPNAAYGSANYSYYYPVHARKSNKF